MISSKTLIAAAAALALCACRSEPAPPPDAAPRPIVAPAPHDWTARSADGRVTVRQSRAADACAVEAEEGGKVRWRVAACVATRTDLVFVSPDGERLLVLHPLPEHGGNDWSELTVAALWVRGARERTVLGAELVAHERITEMSRDFSWVRGVGSSGGAPPRYAGSGSAVALETVDGAALELGFDGSGIPGRRAPAPRAGPAPGALALPGPPSPERGGTWQWEDRDGSVHFSAWHEVPEERRARARPVTATVGTIAVDRVASPPSSYSGRSAAPPSAWGSRPAPPAAGPRLNGLTDAERRDQEEARAAAAERKRRADEAQFQEIHRRDVEAAFLRSYGWRP